MSEVWIVALNADELEVAQLALDLVLTGTPAPLSASRRPVLERVARKVTGVLEGRRQSLEQLQAAMHALYDAGLLTLEDEGVPVNLAEIVTQLKSAAEFYADHAQYSPIELGEAHTAGCGPGDPRVLQDRGARARRALRVEGVTR